ncbi:MAG TPA: hypothetical protein VG122_07920 [Gemmata sp.]|jgi:hypothetical protein|nr:hypothetical protein [Gemmata sp.]
MLEAALELVFEVAIYGIGHLILWCITFGRWKFSSKRDDLAAIIGIIFWIAIGAGIWFVFFR